MTLAIRESGIGASALVEVASKRLESLSGEMEVLEVRRKQIDSELERVQAEVTHLRGLLALHGVIVDQRPAASTGDQATIADQVISVIRQAKAPLHYREVYESMKAAGLFQGGGQDPANTLLAKYFNDKRLYRPARGTYALREWQPGAASVGTKTAKRRYLKGV